MVFLLLTLPPWGLDFAKEGRLKAPKSVFVPKTTTQRGLREGVCACTSVLVYAVVGGRRGER